MTSFTDTPAINLLPTRLTWMRLNRLLAWALLVSPMAQLFCSVHLATGMLIDFGLLLAHGALSLVLFGMPKVKRSGFTFLMHVMGGRPADLSARNRFLLSGYRIALGLTPLLTTLPGVPWFTVLPFLYPILRMPISVMQHIRDAVQYALRRWGYGEIPTESVVFLYLLFAITNFFHAASGAMQ
jgi:hypothetical protein